MPEGRFTPEMLAAVQSSLGSALAAFLPGRRWFGGKARSIADVTLADLAPLPACDAAVLAIVDVRSSGGASSRYAVLLGLGPMPDAPAIGEIATASGVVTVVEASASPQAARALMAGFAAGAGLATVAGGRLVYGDISSKASAVPWLDLPADAIRAMGQEQSNTSLRLADTFVFKLFRRLDPGENPEVEISRFLVSHGAFRDTPTLHGSLTYAPPEGPPMTIGALQALIPNEGDGWTYVVGRLEARARGAAGDDWIQADCRRLGRITAAFHDALASPTSLAAFRLEPVVPADVDAWRSSVRARALHAADLLDARAPTLDDAMRPVAQAAASRLARWDGGDLPDVGGPGGFAKMRVHGDYHLGQTLKTADGFVVLDFEGEPMRTLGERRRKTAALKDVAGMLRSFDYACETARRRVAGAAFDAAGLSAMRHAFLDGYRGGIRRPSPYLPDDDRLFEAWLRFFELDKAVSEIEYEAYNRPDWLAIPLGGAWRLFESAAP